MMTRTTTSTMDDIKPPSLFVFSPHHLTASPFNVRASEGVLVDEPAEPFSFAVNIATPVYSDAEIFKMWLGFHETMPSGVEPVISDFLRDNPRYLGQNAADTLGGSKSTPRTWTSLSDLIQDLNGHVGVTGANGQWVAPSRLVCLVVGREPGLALLQYAKDKGLEVLDAKPKAPAMHLGNDFGYSPAP